jgi:hypothetical protein
MKYEFGKSFEHAMVKEYQQQSRVRMILHDIIMVLSESYRILLKS